MSSKTKRIGTTLLIALFAVGMAACDFVGTAYKVIDITATSVDTAMTAYANDVYPTGTVSPENHIKVREIYITYQSAALTAVAAIRSYDNVVKAKNASSEDMALAKQHVVLALQNLQKTYINLVDLLSKLGVKQAKTLQELTESNSAYKIY